MFPETFLIPRTVPYSQNRSLFPETFLIPRNVPCSINVSCIHERSLFPGTLLGRDSSRLITECDLGYAQNPNLCRFRDDFACHRPLQFIIGSQFQFQLGSSRIRKSRKSLPTIGTVRVVLRRQKPHDRVRFRVLVFVSIVRNTEF